MEPEKQVVSGLEAGWYARSTSRKVGEVVTAHVYVEEEDDAVRCDHGERIPDAHTASTQSLLTCLYPATAPRVLTPQLLLLSLQLLLAEIRTLMLAEICKYKQSLTRAFRTCERREQGEEDRPQHGLRLQ